MRSSYHTLAEPARVHPNQLRFLRAGVPFQPSTSHTHNHRQRSPRLHPIPAPRITSTSPTPSLVSSLDSYSTATSSSLAVPTLAESADTSAPLEELGDSWFTAAVKDGREGRYWACARKILACLSCLAGTACLGYGIFHVIVFIRSAHEPDNVWCHYYQKFP